MKSFFKYLFLLVFLSQFSFSQNRIDSDLIDSKIIRLNNHEIEFYWNLEPLNAENAFDISVLKNPQILKLPRANWGQLENTERKGFGTFVYRVSLPDTTHSYALFTPRFSGGVKIWVNDQLQGSHGVYNRDVKESSSYAKPLQINLPKEKKIVVTILTANNEQFLQLSGVGENKLEKYAAAFLKVISEHVSNEKQDVTDTVSESLLLFRSGLNVDTIASQRNIKTTTVYSHLASCIEQGELKLNEVIDLNEQEINIIHETLLSVDDGSRKLKPVYDALDGMFDYHTLRCVQAAVIPG